MPCRFDTDDQPLPAVLHDADAVRAIDARAIDEQGVAGFELMRRAAEYAFALARRRWPDARHVQVLCGGGNNGGDGYLFACAARREGLQVTVNALRPRQPPGGDAGRAYAAWTGGGGEVRPLELTVEARAELVVDALFGTGLARPVTGDVARVLEHASVAPVPVLALDLPSGLDADRGTVLGTAVVADATATFIALKQGLFMHAGLHHGGAVGFNDLGVDAAVVAAEPAAAERLHPGRLRDWLGRRARHAHKGDHGHVLVIGGELGYAGAARLAAQGALRAGAGLVSVATRAAHAADMPVAVPEVMARGVETPAELEALARRATVIAVGPGLGQADWGRQMFELATALEPPKVVDADGLNWLARLGGRREDWILTPHPGEAARLLNAPGAEVQSDRVGAARAIAARFGGVCVLKGAGTVVCDGTRVAVVHAGNPGLAAGGSGDVLTGVVAAMLAQRLAAWDAACAGALAHAHAGDLAAAGGERGLLATDVIGALRTAVNPSP